MFFLYNKLTASSRKYDDILKEKNADVEKKDVTLNLHEKKNVEEYKKNNDVFKNEEDNFFFVFDDKEINKLNKIKEEQCNMKENEFINEKGYILNDENVSTINYITSLNNDIIHSSDKNICTNYNIYPSNGNNNNNNNNIIHSNNSNIFVNDSHMENFDDMTDEFFKIDQTNFSFFQFNTSFENKKNINEEELMKHTDNINLCDTIIDKKKNCNTLSDLIHNDNLFNDNLNIYEDNNNNNDDVISTDLFMLKNNYNKNFEKNEIDVVVDTSTTFENINHDNNEKNLYNLNNQMSDKELLNNNKDDIFYIYNKFLISENNILLEDKVLSFIDRKIESNKCEDYCVNNNNNNERNNLSDILENAYSKNCEPTTINEDIIYNNFEDMDKISHDAFDFIIPSSFNKEEDNGNEKYQNVFDSNKDNLENINVEDPPFSNFSEEKQNFFQNCDMSENIWLNKKFDEHNVFEKNERYEHKNVYENENYDQKGVDESSEFFENNVFFWDDKNKNVDEINDRRMGKIIDSGVEENCGVEEKFDEEEEKTYFVEAGIKYGNELPRRNFEEIDENYEAVVEEKYDEKMGENFFEEVEEKFDEKMRENIFEEVEEKFDEKMRENVFEEVEEKYDEKKGENIFEEVEEKYDEKKGENIFEEVEEKFDEKMGEFFVDEVKEKFDEKMGEFFVDEVKEKFDEKMGEFFVDEVKEIYEEVPKKYDMEIEEKYSEKIGEIHDEKIKDEYDERYEKIHDEKKEVEEFFLIADENKEENEDSNVEILNIDKNNFYFENKETFEIDEKVSKMNEEDFVYENNETFECEDIFLKRGDNDDSENEKELDEIGEVINIGKYHLNNKNNSYDDVHILTHDFKNELLIEKYNVDNICSDDNIYDGENICGDDNIYDGDNICGDDNIYDGDNICGDDNIDGGDNICGGDNIYDGDNINSCYNINSGDNVENLLKEHKIAFNESEEIAQDIKEKYEKRDNEFTDYVKENSDIRFYNKGKGEMVKELIGEYSEKYMDNNIEDNELVIWRSSIKNDKERLNDDNIDLNNNIPNDYINNNNEDIKNVHDSFSISNKYELHDIYGVLEKSISSNDIKSIEVCVKKENEIHHKNIMKKKKELNNDNNLNDEMYMCDISKDIFKNNEYTKHVDDIYTFDENNSNNLIIGEDEDCVSSMNFEYPFNISKMNTESNNILYKQNDKKKTNINSVKHPMTYIKGFEYASDSINFLKALKGLPPLPFLKCKDMKPYMRLFNIVLKVIESNDYNDNFVYVLMGDETGCVYVKLYMKYKEYSQVDNTIMLANCHVTVENGHIVLSMNEYSNIFLLKYDSIKYVKKNINYSESKFVVLSEYGI
ncbi:hypothetical protein PRSY57_0201700 [Plasmodium reichenowi]|uniref:RGS domain-containing protein n=1 Tax=Plasmodium reichenowi TaxID=5854 RepID=A0A151LUT7_PLARE|nr:hypothetical protein PRSY57_0201700 [Plasmodium reichenowi]KYO02944.1 hypothetical protein PRSY57_0201700 [Plasmodium reichenowi]